MSVVLTNKTKHYRTVRVRERNYRPCRNYVTCKCVLENPVVMSKGKNIESESADFIDSIGMVSTILILQYLQSII